MQRAAGRRMTGAVMGGSQIRRTTSCFALLVLTFLGLLLIPVCSPTSAVAAAPNGEHGSLADRADSIWSDDPDWSSERVPMADIRLAKAVSRSRPNVGSTITVAITVINHGPALATNIQIREVLPSGLRSTSVTSDQGYYRLSDGVWEIRRLAVGAGALLLINAVVEGAGPQVSLAEVTHLDQTDPNPQNNWVRATITGQMADLGLTVTAMPAQPNVGEHVVFTLRVTNRGPSQATNVRIELLLAPGLTFVTAETGRGSLTNDHELWTIGNLADGNSAVLAVTARVDLPGPVSLLADVSDPEQPDPDPGDNRASATVIGQLVDLVLMAFVDNSEPRLGERVTLSVSIHNYGPNQATGIRLESLLPPSIIRATVTVQPESLMRRDTAADNGDRWVVGPIDTGQTVLLIIRALANEVGTARYTAAIRQVDQRDAALDDNQASIVLVVQPGVVPVEETRRVTPSLR